MEPNEYLICIPESNSLKYVVAKRVLPTLFNKDSDLSFVNPNNVLESIRSGDQSKYRSIILYQIIDPVLITSIRALYDGNISIFTSTDYKIWTLYGLVNNIFVGSKPDPDNGSIDRRVVNYLPDLDLMVKSPGNRSGRIDRQIALMLEGSLIDQIKFLDSIAKVFSKLIVDDLFTFFCIRLNWGSVRSIDDGFVYGYLLSRINQITGQKVDDKFIVDLPDIDRISVKRTLKRLSSCSLCVTDSKFGYNMSVITETPCIMVDSKEKLSKVKLYKTVKQSLQDVGDLLRVQNLHLTVSRNILASTFNETGSSVTKKMYHKMLSDRLPDVTIGVDPNVEPPLISYYVDPDQSRYLSDPHMLEHFKSLMGYSRTKGVMLILSVELSFNDKYLVDSGQIPYLEEWIGILWSGDHTLKSLLENKMFVGSIHMCRALYVTNSNMVDSMSAALERISGSDTTVDFLNSEKLVENLHLLINSL